jgi:hypothetical protein
LQVPTSHGAGSACQVELADTVPPTKNPGIPPLAEFPLSWPRFSADDATQYAGCWPLPVTSLPSAVTSPAKTYTPPFCSADMSSPIKVTEPDVAPHTPVSA